jgi:hypothetical protein
LSYPDIVNTANHHVGAEVKHVPILLHEVASVELETIAKRMIKTRVENLPVLNWRVFTWPGLTGLIGSYFGSRGQSMVDAKIESQTGIDPNEFYATAAETYKTFLIHLSRHSMEDMFNAFDADTGMPLKAFKVKAWPSNANQMVQYEMLLRSSPYNFPNELTREQQFKLKHTIGYDIKEVNPHALHFNQFEPHVVSFLRDYKRRDYKKIASIVDQELSKIIDIENIEIADDQIGIKNRRNIFVLKQYITNKLTPIEVHADVNLDLMGSSGGEACTDTQRNFEAQNNAGAPRSYLYEHQFQEPTQYYSLGSESDNQYPLSNHAIKFYIESPRINTTFQTDIPFDSGKWDSEIQQHTKTGEPIFVYRVYKENVEVGTASFYKHRLLCRSEDGTRHNIMQFTGVLEQIQEKINLATASFEEICAALPPMPLTFFEQTLEDVKEGASKGALLGGWRGLSNVVEYGLQKQNVATWKTFGVKYTVYYGGIFLTQFYQHYSQQSTEQIGLVSSVYHAAFETMQMGLMQEYLYQFSYLAQKMSTKAHNANWHRTGNALDVASHIMGYGIYSYNVYGQGLVQTVTSVGTGIGVERLTETVGKKAIDHFLESHTKALKPKPLTFNKLNHPQETKREEYHEEVENRGNKSTFVYSNFTNKHLADDLTGSLNDDVNEKDTEESDPAFDTELENISSIQGYKP